MNTPLLVEHDTVSRLVRASEIGFLVDTDAYFSAFAEAASRGRDWIGVVGWDLDSREDLGRARWSHEGLPRAFGPFLDALVRRREALRVDLLVWQSAAIYAFERELFPQVKLGWATHPRLRFEMDAEHPPGASHHQKVAVIDDTVAFVGGIDLTGHRWDTPAHLPDDPRRRNPWGLPYGPFHDLQMGVSGEAAVALGELVRTRWQRATGEALEAPCPARGRPCPFAADLRDVDVGLVLTDAGAPGSKPVRQTERLHLRAIAAARREIYAENQYLTSRIIARALEQRLGDPDGPEVIVVTSERASGWIERTTMDYLRAHRLAALRRADRYGRLRVYSPVVDDRKVFVHSKCLIVDGSVLYLGSANLSDRSMGLDTECGLALEERGRPEVGAAVHKFLCRLLGEHLGESPEAIADAFARAGSLGGTIDALNGGRRALVPLPGDEAPPRSEVLERWLAAGGLVDPHEPVQPERFLSQMLRAAPPPPDPPPAPGAIGGFENRDDPRREDEIDDDARSDDPRGVATSRAGSDASRARRWGSSLW